MVTKIRIITVLMLVLFIVSCTTKISDYSNGKNEFDLKKYFDGSVIARGIIQDYSGKVTRRFCVDIQGSWQNNVGTLAETFYFDDGEVSYRNWQLTKQADTSFIGTAEDVVGEAIGVHQGFAFQLTYQLLLEVDGETYQVSMDDWMYQLDEFRVMNKTAMHKFGVKVADVTLFFDKSKPLEKCYSA